MPVTSERQGVAVKLYEYVSVHDIVALSPTRDRVAQVQDKWVYVFKKEESAAALFYECKPVVQGTEQTFEFAAYRDGDPGTDLKTLLLQPEEEYFILLSEIQLQPERVDYYTQHGDELLKRATHLIINSLKAGTEPVNIYLTDFIECTYYLRNEYDKCVQEHEAYISDKDRAQRIYLAGLVCEVARAKPRLKGWLDYGAVVKERDEHDKEVKRRLQEKENAEKNLCGWKRSDGYMLTRDDYNGVKEIEEQILEHEAALTTLDEIKYLETEGEDKKSWLNEIFDHEGRFIFFRKLETLSSLENFWDLFGKYIVAKYLVNFGPTKMKAVLSVEVQTQRIESVFLMRYTKSPNMQT